jgi:hypothetical protein
MSKSDTPSENIDFERIREIAEGVAKYAGRYTGSETFMGYNLKEITPLLPKHADSIPLKGKVKIVFEHWSVVDDRVGFKSQKPYPDPETIDHRVMSYVVSAKDLLEYEEELNGHNEPGDPNGDFDLIDWSDVAVSSGKVPDDVVDELCEYLANERADFLAEEFSEAFKRGELPKWDPRVLKVVEEDCRRSILQDEEYEAMLAAETPEQRKLREGRFWSNMRMVSGSWIGQEVMDTLASIKFYKELRDRTDDPEERKRFQEKLDFLIGSGMVTEEDVARSEKHDREQANES